mgnify:CR=1 FL=1
MNTVNKPFRKKDAMQLVTGQPVYMDDVIPQDCLIVKLLVVEIYEKGGARHQSFRIENTDLVAAKPISELHLK